MKEVYIDRFWLGVKYFLISLLLGFIIRGFVLIPVPVTGYSMKDTLNQGDMVLMEKFTKVKRFDVIVFEMDDGTNYIKRVIGMPGDSIVYKQDELIINGKTYPEPYLEKNDKPGDTGYTTDFTLSDIIGEQTLPEGSYFVMGDNRRNSKDSRSFGTVKKHNILGKARLIYYPFKHIKFIS